MNNEFSENPTPDPKKELFLNEKIQNNFSSLFNNFYYSKVIVDRKTNLPLKAFDNINLVFDTKIHSLIKEFPSYVIEQQPKHNDDLTFATCTGGYCCLRIKYFDFYVFTNIDQIKRFVEDIFFLGNIGEEITPSSKNQLYNLALLLNKRVIDDKTDKPSPISEADLKAMVLSVWNEQDKFKPLIYVRKSLIGSDYYSSQDQAKLRRIGKGQIVLLELNKLNSKYKYQRIIDKLPNLIKTMKEEQINISPYSLSKKLFPLMKEYYKSDEPIEKMLRKIINGKHTAKGDTVGYINIIYNLIMPNEQKSAKGDSIGCYNTINLPIPNCTFLKNDAKTSIKECIDKLINEGKHISNKIILQNGNGMYSLRSVVTHSKKYRKKIKLHNSLIKEKDKSPSSSVNTNQVSKEENDYDNIDFDSIDNYDYKGPY